MNERQEYFKARVSDEGKVLFSDLARVNNHLQTLRGGDIYVLFIEIPEGHTDAQRQFFHSVIIEDVQRGLLQMGYAEAQDKKFVKDLIKHKFLTREKLNETTGEVITYTRNTSSLSKDEYSWLIDSVIRWAAEWLGVTVRNPKDYGY